MNSLPTNNTMCLRCGICDRSSNHRSVDILPVATTGPSCNSPVSHCCDIVRSCTQATWFCSWGFLAPKGLTTRRGIPTHIRSGSFSPPIDVGGKPQGYYTPPHLGSPAPSRATLAHRPGSGSDTNCNSPVSHYCDIVRFGTQVARFCSWGFLAPKGLTTRRGIPTHIRSGSFSPPIDVGGKPQGYYTSAYGEFYINGG